MTDKEKMKVLKQLGYHGSEIGKKFGISKQRVDVQLTKEDKKDIKKKRANFLTNFMKKDKLEVALEEAWIRNLFES